MTIAETTSFAEIIVEVSFVEMIKTSSAAVAKTSEGVCIETLYEVCTEALEIDEADDLADEDLID